MKQAGVPDEVTFTTKPHLLIEMVEEEIAAGTPFGYFAADSGYGRDPALRAFFHRRELPYVMAVPVDLPLIGERENPIRPDELFKRLGVSRWERRSAGNGTKGGCYYDWGVPGVRIKGRSPADEFAHTLLIRRSVGKPRQIEFFLVHARTGTPIPELIAIAGLRWKIEEDNEHGKDLLGLNEYQVRKWIPWHRHVTTCMLALAFLAVTRVRIPAFTDGQEETGGEVREPAEKAC